jgi:hypothetical protein
MAEHMAISFIMKSKILNWGHMQGLKDNLEKTAFQKLNEDYKQQIGFVFNGWNPGFYFMHTCSGFSKNIINNNNFSSDQSSYTILLVILHIHIHTLDSSH